MARNEEKQLARLNRWYLQKQREDEAKKRPPRPKLDTLDTAEDVKKWIPTITRDIDFYIKQMEVPCYPEHVISDFSQRIDHLKGEYKAFLCKLRRLCPEEKATPWSDRPYLAKRRTLTGTPKEDDIEQTTTTETLESFPQDNSHDSFVPLSTPILDSDVDYSRLYGYAKPSTPPVSHHIDDESQNHPLELLPIPKPNLRQRNTKPVNFPRVSGGSDSNDLDPSWSSYRTGGQLSTGEIKEIPSLAMIITRDENSVVVSEHFSKHLSSPHDPLCSNPDKGSECETSIPNCNNNVNTINSLNLPYTDSSSEDSDENT